MREDEQEEAKLWEKVASPDRDTKVDALLQLSYNAAGQQEYTEALAFCETARETYEALGALASSMKMAHIYFGIGHCLRHLNRSADAAIALEKSVELYQEVGSEDALHILNEEGDAWYEAKEYQKSYGAYRRAIEDSNPDTCDSIVARNYVDAGTALERLKEWSKALEHFTEGRARYKKLKDLRIMAHCDEEISLCYVWLGDGVESGEITEIFACGTAAVVSPVGQAKSTMGTWVTGDGQPGVITMQIRNHLLGIQHGTIADTHNWIKQVC